MTIPREEKLKEMHNANVIANDHLQIPNNGTRLFSFGCGQPSANRWVRLASRDDMVAIFDSRWSMDYADTPKSVTEFRAAHMREISIENAVLNFLNFHYPEPTPDDYIQFVLDYPDGHKEECATLTHHIPCDCGYTKQSEWLRSN